MRVAEIVKKAEEFGIAIRPAIRMRIRYLIGVAGQWDEYIAGGTNDIPPLDMRQILAEIDACRRYEARLESGGRMAQGVTDEMIQQAREYPIDQLIEFKKGVALAFCHDDKHPSLSFDKKRNKARCFSCGINFDSIDVLCKRDNYTFLDAVRYLTHGN